MKSFTLIIAISLFTIGCASKSKINDNCSKLANSSGIKQCKKSHSTTGRDRSFERFGRHRM